jgi:hypothetical protein
VDELNAELNGRRALPRSCAAGQGRFETFRGISHLLMERVTKDLRRAPGAVGVGNSAQAASPPPRPAVEPVAPRGPAAAPPLAPARAMERETQQTAPSAPVEEYSTAYGRNLDLPDEIPPSPSGIERMPEAPPVTMATLPANDDRTITKPPSSQPRSETRASSRLPAGSRAQGLHVERDDARQEREARRNRHPNCSDRA